MMSGTAENAWAYSNKGDQFDKIMEITNELGLLPNISTVSSIDVIAALQNTPAEKLIKYSYLSDLLREHRFIWGPVIER